MDPQCLLECLHYEKTTQAGDPVPTDYQPSKAELKRKHKIKATPEELAKAVMQDVCIKYVD